MIIFDDFCLHNSFKAVALYLHPNLCLCRINHSSFLFTIYIDLPFKPVDYATSKALPVALSKTSPHYNL